MPCINTVYNITTISELLRSMEKMLGSDTMKKTHNKLIAMTYALSCNTTLTYECSDNSIRDYKKDIVIRSYDMKSCGQTIEIWLDGMNTY